MILLDLLIIYLTLGAPVSVYYFYLRGTPNDLRGWASLIAAFAFWPPFAYQIVRYRNENAQFGTEIVGIASLDAGALDRVDKIISEIEKIEIPGHGNELAKLIDTLRTYCDLRVAHIADARDLGGLPELLAIAGNEFPTAAISCMRRRNRKAIERHLTGIEKAVHALIHSFDRDERRKFENLFRLIFEAFGDQTETTHDSVREWDVTAQSSMEQWEQRPMTSGG